MPQLSDLVEKRKFVKKEYRPWDLSGSGTVDGLKESLSAEQTTSREDQITELAAVTQQHVQQSVTESGNKSGNDLDNKRVTNRQHTGNNQVTQKIQTGNIRVTNREHTGNVLDNELDNVLDNNSRISYLVKSIKKLSGIQKVIFYYVINICSARGVLDTGNVLSSDLANAANCTIGSAKTSLIRLVEKQLVLRLQGKPSRGGHTVLGITKEIQSAAIQAQQALFNPLKISQTGNVLGNVLDNEKGNMPYSSSNIYINTITTTSLPEDWKKINFEGLQHIGFSETQLRQLYDCNMTAVEIVQDSIHRFAFSLEHSAKVKAYSDPLNVLMGILRKGQRWNEPNYISPKEFALKQILEEKRQAKEKRDMMIKELADLDFPEWKRKLTEEDIIKIVPSDVRKANIPAAMQSMLKAYFVENILLPKIDVDE